MKAREPSALFYLFRSALPRGLVSRWVPVTVFCLLAAWVQAGSVAEFASGSIGLSQVIAPVGQTATFAFDVNPTGLPPETTTGQVAQFGYLNVMAGTTWLVRNEPIPLTETVAVERNNVWFTDFNQVVGTTPLSVDAIINAEPFSFTPTPDSTWTSATVTPGSFSWALPGSEGETGPVTPPVNPTPPPPPDVTKIEGFLRGGVADIKQYRNECGPTSAANSLIYLAKKYGLGPKLPTKPDGTIDYDALVLALAQAMTPGWAPQAGLPDRDGHKDRGYQGLAAGELFNGKIAFSKAQKLGLVVEGGHLDPKSSGANTFSFVRNELKKKQDVEFLIRWPNDGAHWVTVTGYIDAGKDNKTLIVHDPYLANGNNYWKINDAGVLSSPVGTAGYAVAESIPDGNVGPLFCVAVMLVIALKRGIEAHNHERDHEHEAA